MTCGSTYRRGPRRGGAGRWETTCRGSRKRRTTSPPGRGSGPTRSGGGGVGGGGKLRAVAAASGVLLRRGAGLRGQRGADGGDLQQVQLHRRPARPAALLHELDQVRVGSSVLRRGAGDPQRAPDARGRGGARRAVRRGA